MSEELKKYFQENREGLDKDKPSKDLWAKIELGLDNNAKVVSLSEKENLKGNKRNLFGNWLKAAAVLLFTFGLGYFIANDKSLEKEIAKKKIDVSQIDLAKINPEVSETEHYYMTNIRTVRQELKKYQKDNPDLVMGFLMEQQNFINDYNQLKMHLIDNANNEQIINLMIQNLRMQEEILIQYKNLLQNNLNEKSFEYKKI